MLSTLSTMTLRQFNRLDEIKQIEVIWNNGALIAGRKENSYKILLYQIGIFYVEVYYHVVYNQVVKLKSFSDTDLLEPYLKTINLSLLLAE